MDSVNVPGAIASLSHEGCLATIGCVIASMSKETLQELVNAFNEIERTKTRPLAMIAPEVKPGHGWSAIALDVKRKIYVLNLRGVCWETGSQELEAFVQKGAVPFLARGTTSKLLQGIADIT